MLATYLTKTLTNQVRIASFIDQKAVMSAMILAFNNDPFIRWMYPHPYQYLNHFPNLVNALGREAFDKTTAYLVSDDLNADIGAALWLPPGVAPAVDGVIEHLRQSIFESQQATLFKVFEQMGEYHPHEPHWYLPFLGVEPSQQGKGFGSALIQPVLMKCDRDLIPAYLESSNSANIPFYERHGFELLGSIKVGEAPPIFPMMRHPK